MGTCGGVAFQDEQPVTLEQATSQFIADAEARNLKDKTVYKYRLLFRQLTAFAKDRGIRFVKEFDPSRLRTFRAGWKDQNLAAQKKLERLRSFFRFSLQNGWISTNPATEIKSPKVIMRPTMPFSRDEMLQILAAIAERIDGCDATGKANVRRLRALVLLLRYSGLASRMENFVSIHRKQERTYIVRFQNSWLRNSKRSP